jgi:hypothetical protein
MVHGTPEADKTTLVAALFRSLAVRRVRVAPFRANEPKKAALE